MKKITYIKKGSLIDTQIGYLEILGINCGGHIYCREVEVDEDGNETSEEKLLTGYEIERAYHDYCGKWVKFLFMEDEENE